MIIIIKNIKFEYIIIKNIDKNKNITCYFRNLFINIYNNYILKPTTDLL